MTEEAQRLTEAARQITLEKITEIERHWASQRYLNDYIARSDTKEYQPLRAVYVEHVQILLAHIQTLTRENEHLQERIARVTR